MNKWIICASGPSMGAVDVGMIRRFKSWRVMAVNCTWELVPWADVLYSGDGQWWDRYGSDVAGFQGEKWTRDFMAAHAHKLNLARGRDGVGLCRDRGFVNTGGNSGYQAVNLAWHFGARKIILLGFDMHRHAGAHWHGDHRPMPDGKPMLSAPLTHIPMWRRAFVPMAQDLAEDGVEVVNSTEGSSLTCFLRTPLAEALRL